MHEAGLFQRDLPGHPDLDLPPVVLAIGDVVIFLASALIVLSTCCFCCSYLFAGGFGIGPTIQAVVSGIVVISVVMGLGQIASHLRSPVVSGFLFTFVGLMFIALVANFCQRNRADIRVVYDSVPVVYGGPAPSRGRYTEIGHVPSVPLQVSYPQQAEAVNMMI